MDSKKSCIYFFWSISGISATKSWIISYLIIVLTSPKFFILNSFMSWSFIHSNISRLLDLRTRSSTYIPTIIYSLFHLMVRMHTSTLVGVKLIFRKNLKIVLFQSFPTYFNPYKLFNILQTSLFWPARHPWEIFI